MKKWSVTLKESVIDDLRWFGRRPGRVLLKETGSSLSEDPTQESRNMKTLRPNPVAEREFSLFGKYRVLFNVNEQSREVTIVLVGEKRGATLLVQGKEFRLHHESDFTE